MTDPTATSPRAAQTREVRAAYWLADVVYLRVRGGEKVAGMVTAIFVRASGVLYGVTWGNTACESCHYGFELSGEYEADFQA